MYLNEQIVRPTNCDRKKTDQAPIQSYSKVVVFRQGGILGRNESWKFNNVPVEVTNSYIYLGVKFTPGMSFVSHIEDRTKKAKTSIYGAWENLLNDNNIDIKVKSSIFKSAIRGIQCYAGQVFGYGYEENINGMQLFFLKYILRLPNSTPTYALYLETKECPTYVYTLQLHMNYIFKTLFTYDENRLPHILEKKIFWYKEWRNLEESTMIRWEDVPFDKVRWKYCIRSSIENFKMKHFNNCLEQKSKSTSRFYKHLSHNVNYLSVQLSARDKMYIFKARCDELGLRTNFYGNEDKNCLLCDLNRIENVVGVCPKFVNVRQVTFGKDEFVETEIIELLDGTACEWKTLAEFIKKTLELKNM